MKTYRITSPLLKVSQDCPPDLVPMLFANYGDNGWSCSLVGNVCFVTAPEPQVPADLGPLVLVEEVQPS